MAGLIVPALVVLGTLACAGSATLTIAAATPTPTSPPTPSPTETKVLPALTLTKTPITSVPVPTDTPFPTRIRPQGSLIVVLTPTLTRIPKATPTAVPTATAIPTATPTLVPTPVATVAPSPTPAPTPTAAPSPTPTVTPTPTPTLLEGPTLSINGILVEPGSRTVAVANGSVPLSLAPSPGGGYPLNASLTLLANLDFPGFPIAWAGVDSQDGFLASVKMGINRHVVIVMGAPTPTPKPQRAVSGALTSLTRWTIDFDYVVTGDLEIATGTNLNIDPGTTVKFAADTKLEVNGTLNAVGTSSLPVVFTSDSKWGGIQILNTTSTSVISYGVIERVDGTALDINNGLLRLDNTVVRQSTQGIWVRSNGANMFANEIHSNEIGVVTGVVSSVNMRDSTIRENNVGIQVVGPKGSVFFKGNNILDNVEFKLLIVGVGNRSVNASSSWSGTTDKTVIAGKIRDQQDDAFLSAVVFEPIALQRIATAP